MRVVTIRAVLFGVFAAAATALAGLAPACGAEESEREAALKAAFLYNFAKFTEWPRQRPDAETGPMLFCVGPNSRLRTAVTELHGKQIGARDVRVVLTDAVSPTSCHVLFIDDTVSPGLRRLVETNLYGVLTVSDLPNFARSGGDIGFFFAQNQLRFQINLDASRRRGLGFSSKLLRLADVIGQQSGLPSRLAAAPPWIFRF